jgi:hypothetical protein
MATTHRLCHHGYHGVLVDRIDLHLKILSFVWWYFLHFVWDSGLVDYILENIRVRIWWLT